MHHPTDWITHTMAFVTPVVEHWLEREIAQWVHPMKDRSDDLHQSSLAFTITAENNKKNTQEITSLRFIYQAILHNGVTLFVE